jgi:hypothetical protein
MVKWKLLFEAEKNTGQICIYLSETMMYFLHRIFLILQYIFWAEEPVVKMWTGEAGLFLD